MPWPDSWGNIRVEPATIIGPLILLISFGLLAGWSWQKWPDIFIDFGIQLYLPWQLSLGKILYVDIAWKNGPLSGYFNAILFRFFGVSLFTLVISNLIFVALSTGAMYDFFRRSTTQLTATLVCFVFLTVFCFSQYIGVGNYNFICPYIYEQTHGVELSLVALWSLGRFAGQRNRWWCLVTGLCWGLVFLTRAEVWVALSAAIGVGFWLLWRKVPEERLHLRLAGGICLGIGLVPVLAMGLFLWAQMPFKQAMSGVCANWVHLFTSDLGNNMMYRTLTGLDAPGANLLYLGVSTAGLGIILAGIIALNAKVGKLLNPSLGWCVGIGVIVFMAAFMILNRGWWTEVARPLPAICIVGFSWFVWQGGKQTDSELFCQRYVPLAVWAMFSLGMLGKLGLSPRLSFYGFTLAMPAMLLAVACFTEVIPSMLRAKFGDAGLFQACALGGILAIVAVHLHWSDQFYAYKTLQIGENGDALLTYDPQIDAIGYVIGITAEELKTMMGPQETLLVLPEGAMLNYLCRRVNSTPYLAFLPIDLATFGGEIATLQAIQQHPPDYIVITNRDMTEFGKDFFGRDPTCGKLIVTWVQANYLPLKTVGAPLNTPGGFGATIFKRNTRP